MHIHIHTHTYIYIYMDHKPLAHLALEVGSVGPCRGRSSLQKEIGLAHYGLSMVKLEADREGFDG